MKKNIIHLITGLALLTCGPLASMQQTTLIGEPNASTPQQAAVTKTSQTLKAAVTNAAQKALTTNLIVTNITLEKDSFYVLPPLTLSTTTPTPDKVIGYAILGANRGAKIRAGYTTESPRMGAMRTRSYICEIKKGAKSGTTFSVVQATVSQPNGDKNKPVVTITIK